MSALRFYEQDELGADGYPLAWHRGCIVLDDILEYPEPGTAIPPQFELGIKHHVRDLAGNRCVRCLHPWSPAGGDRPDGPEWSPCDERCEHRSPLRIVWPDGDELHDRGSVDPDAYLPREVMAAYDGGTVEAQWRVLTVHHLDGDKANCRWFNLAALCQRCHLQIQGKVQMKRVWPWEHTEWFRPYVAGYYAFVYLGEDLERPAVEGRLDELLALERAA